MCSLWDSYVLNKNYIPGKRDIQNHDFCSTLKSAFWKFKSTYMKVKGAKKKYRIYSLISRIQITSQMWW